MGALPTMPSRAGRLAVIGRHLLGPVAATAAAAEEQADPAETAELQSAGRKQNFASQHNPLLATQDPRGSTAYALWLEKDWTGNVEWNASTVVTPQSLSELQKWVRNGVAPVRAVRQLPAPSSPRCPLLPPVGQ